MNRIGLCGVRLLKFSWDNQAARNSMVLLVFSIATYVEIQPKWGSSFEKYTWQTYSQQIEVDGWLETKNQGGSMETLSRRMEDAQRYVFTCASDVTYGAWKSHEIGISPKTLAFSRESSCAHKRKAVGSNPARDAKKRRETLDFSKCPRRSFFTHPVKNC